MLLSFILSLLSIFSNLHLISCSSIWIGFSFVSNNCVISPFFSSGSDILIDSFSNNLSITSFLLLISSKCCSFPSSSILIVSITIFSSTLLKFIFDTFCLSSFPPLTISNGSTSSLCTLLLNKSPFWSSFSKIFSIISFFCWISRVVPECLSDSKKLFIINQQL